MSRQIASSSADANFHPERAGVRGRWLALFVVLLATFMDLVDVTIVGVALPSIQRDLHAGYAVGQWIVAGYALAYALILVTGGRLGDVYGPRRVFIAGVAGFTVASALAGAAVSPAMLIMARVAQGLFGGVMVPQVMSVVATRFPPGRDRTLAFSLYGALLGVAQVSGPIIGGLLTSYGVFGLGWRLIFYINLPIGLCAIAGAARWMDERPRATARLDLPGVALLALAALLLTVPLVQGREQGWPAWSLAALAASPFALAAFALYERGRAERALVPTTLFRQRSFTAGLVVLLVLFTGIAIYFMTLTWLLQFGLGWSPLHVALTGLAWPAGIACTAQIAYRLSSRHGRRLVRIGMPITALGTAGLAWAVHDGGRLTTAGIVPWMVVGGIGMGLTIPILSTLVIAEVEAPYAGAASGVVNSVVQLGSAIGVALAGVVYFAVRIAPGTAGARTLACAAGTFLLAGLLAPLLPPQTVDDSVTGA